MVFYVAHYFIIVFFFCNQWVLALPRSLMFSPLEQFDAIYLVPLYFPSSHSAIFDFSFNSTILPFLLVNILLVLFIYLYKTEFSLIPTF
jgi:hypothetical protein